MSLDEKEMSLEEKFRELATRLNELMRAYSDGEEGKPIPYLGWFWRSIEPGIPEFMISWTEGHWWIDEAGKWDYPRRWVKGQEAIDILTLCVQTMKSRIELASLLRKDPPKPGEEEEGV